MKVIFEFDTESEDFNSIELERHKQADDMAKALGEILKKARSWDKYDERSAIFRIFTKSSFPRSCLINVPKCGLVSSNEPPSIPKSPIFFGGWFVVNIVVVCFHLIPRRGSMSICGTLTSKIANTAITSARKFY